MYQASMGSLLFVALIVLGVIVFVINTVKKKGARKKLEEQGFRMDHHWAYFSDYIAIDLNASKIAIKGGVPKRHSVGEGIYDIAQIVGAEAWKHPDAHDHISIIVTTQTNDMIEYIVQTKDGNTKRECLETLRGFGIQPPDDLDIAYV